MRNTVLGGVVVVFILFLYYMELNKVDINQNSTMLSLDNLKVDSTGNTWDAFYRVRANIVDGQHAIFSIPEELTEQKGKSIKLEGAFVVFDCKSVGDSSIISSFYLLPTLGLAEACEIQPDISMRWTIYVTLEHEKKIHRNDMIGGMGTVEGNFRINTSQPYHAAFFIDQANLDITSE